ncbi:Cytospin-B, partial [Galemys pyrenaicus]
MRSAAKPWNPAFKAGSHGTDRARPLPAASSGMKSSKSSTSLAFESRLSKLKRASSEDMLNKPGSVAVSGVARLKKTSTAGAISELTENRLRNNPGRREPRRREQGKRDPGRKNPRKKEPGRREEGRRGPGISQNLLQQSQKHSNGNNLEIPAIAPSTVLASQSITSP